MPLLSSNGQSSEPAGGKEPLAIIGIGCRYPGGVGSPTAFWQMLCDEVDAIGDIPPDRFDVDAYYDPKPRSPGKIVTRQGGFLPAVDRFDAYFFGISPREANAMDPQQRLLLEIAWEALEDGGQQPDQLAGSQTGVFVGMWANEYEDLMYGASDDIDLYVTTGGGRYAASGRLSYFFDFRGPSLVIDTACSSSLVAVHLACQSLWAGECTMALAGGVNLILEPQISIGYSRSGMLSPKAHCRFGDADADGYVRSEGAGMVVLKPLAQALADHDPIYALVRGSAVNNDGRSSGLLVAPGVATQTEMLRAAYRAAGVMPGEVHYVEAHGTGTKAGDPTELQALGTVLAEGRTPGNRCLIGSVKTNIGHTEAASGVAGLIKAALSLKHRTIPANLNLEIPNPNIPWEELPLAIERHATHWPEDGQPAYAGVNSFGVTGTNTHVVLQEHRAQAATPALPTEDQRTWLLPLSAHAPAALRQKVAVLKDFLYRQPEGTPRLHDLGYTLALRRSQHEHRLALVAQDQPDLLEQLNTALEDLQASADLQEASAQTKPNVVFVFPGQGSQWVGMGRRLLRQEPVFRQTLAQCEQAMQPYVDWSLMTQLALEEAAPGYRLREIDVIQPTLLSIEIALAALWRAWGVEPAAVVGHSMGEVAAAHVAGALTLEDAMRVICLRSQLLRRTSGQGAMAVVELAVEEAQAALSGYEDRLSIAVSNSPRSTVISGDPAALQEVIDTLQQQQVFCRLIKVDVASHSPQMDPLKADLMQALAPLQPRAGSVPLYSTALGTIIDGASCDASYWVQNLRQPVLFSKMVQHLLADGHTAFIEMSPHPILLPAIQQGMQYAQQQGLVLPSQRRDEAEDRTILHSLGLLYAAGAAIEWERLYPAGGRCISLPTYPWQRERYWFETSGRSRRHRPRRRGDHPLLGDHVVLATGAHLWEFELSTNLHPYLADHRVRDKAVLPAAAYLEMALAAADQVFGSGAHALRGVALKEALFVPDQEPISIQLLITPAALGVATFQVYSQVVGDDGAVNWQLHADGTIVLNQENPPAPQQTPAEIAHHCGQPALDLAGHYAQMARRGLHYGLSFQTIRQLWHSQDHTHSLAALHLPDTIMQDLESYRRHPALLDACLQLLIPALDQAGQPDETRLYLPVAVEKVVLGAAFDGSRPLWGYALPKRGETARGDVFLLDEDGAVVAALYGLEMQPVAQQAESQLDEWLYAVQWHLAPLAQPSTPDGDPGAWLILADDQGVGEQLAVHIAQSGGEPTLVFAGPHFQELGAGRFQMDVTDPAQYNRLLREAGHLQPRDWQGIVHLWGLDATLATAEPADLDALLTQGCLSAVHLVQALNLTDQAEKTRLWLVTRGSQAVAAAPASSGIAQATLWGLGGVIANEHPELPCWRIDLDPGSDPQEVQALWAEMQGKSAETQVALRSGQRYVARLQRSTLSAESEAQTQAPRVEVKPGENYQLTVSTPGILDSLTLAPAERRTPGPGEVEIEVLTTGLNFIDVMKAMGVYPGLASDAAVALGGECAGRIAAVGEGVTDFAVGDAVIAITPSFDTTSCFAAYVVAPTDLVVRKPAHLTFEEAATIPVCFLTAYYAMLHLGRLEAGERVLIHSAAGGVGLAALQLARHVGAEVLATAGTSEKRAYLSDLGVQQVMDSRTLTFVDEVLAQTGGQGVDMVLNSLAGEALQRSFAVLRPYGRFLEIGKRDIYQNSLLGMEPFKRNLAFYAIDLARLAAERPAWLGSMFRRLMAHFEQRSLRPLPLTAFSIGQADEAFRHMAQAKHIGKIVLMHTGAPLLVAKPPSQTQIQADATYLVTGGLGGLGLTVAKWLVDQGARSLVLVGRRGASPTAQAMVEGLEAAGASVRTVRADVTQPKAIADLLRQIEEQMPPLRGVVHAAGILDDGFVLQLDAERFLRVAAPKVHGAWNLHLLTQALPLDFFVLFSSVTALLGSPGQGNYVAGNAFLDALAQHRRAQGQVGLSINWGPWADVGLAAAQANRGERLAGRGLGSITPDQGLLALEKLLRQETAQLAVMPFDPAQWLQATAAAAHAPYYSELVAGLDTPKPRTEGLRQALAAATPGRQRRTLLEEHLREQVAQVLRLPATRIPLNKPLKSLGIDSLMALELRNRLEVSLSLTLSATVVFNYPTVELLTRYLAEKMGIALESAAPSNAEMVVAAHPREEDDLDDLGQDSVEALLEEELATIDDLLREI